MVAGRASLPAGNCRPKAGGRASVRTLHQRGESPCHAVSQRMEVESNCVAARRGGKQLEANEQPVG